MLFCIGEFGKVFVVVDDLFFVRELEGVIVMSEEEDEDLTSRLEALRS